MKLKLCGYVGCRELVADSYFCPVHKAMQEKRKQEYQRTHPIYSRRGSSGEYNSLYRTYRWRKLRAEHLSVYPLCVQCGAPAYVVDHIIPHKGNEDMFFNADNLQSLCASCHSAKTLKENKYFKHNR